MLHTTAASRAYIHSHALWNGCQLLLIDCPQMLPFLLSMPKNTTEFQSCIEVLHSLSNTLSLRSLFPLSQKKDLNFFLSVKQRCSLPQYPAVLRCIASFENKPICIPGLSSSHRLCLVCQKVYGIIKLYGLEGTFKDYLVPTPPSWIGTVSTSPGSSKSHPTRPATLQERGIHIFTGQPAPVSHHSLRN